MLAIIGFFRELLGTGQVFGREVLSPDWYTGNLVMILAPGAFFALGFLVALFNHLKGPEAASSGQRRGPDRAGEAKP